MQQPRPPRPAGITILAVLAILIGVFGLLGGLAIIGLSALVSTSTLPALLTGLGLIVGGVVVIFSLIWLVVGLGFLHGKSWAWTLGMIFSVLSIIGALSLAVFGSYSGIFGVFIWGMMIYYLTRNRVKSFFGKGPAWAPQAFGPPTAFSPSSFGAPTMRAPSGTTSTINTSDPSPGSAVTSHKFCTHCGATLTPGSTSCSSCGQSV